MQTSQQIRKEVSDLSDDNLIDELSRPTGIWKEDVLREALLRTLKKLIDYGKVKP